MKGGVRLYMVTMGSGDDGKCCGREVVLKLWLRIALEWLRECCRLCVVGRKPEHETLCFSV